MGFPAGTEITKVFYTRNTSLVAADFDSAPTTVLRRNGTATAVSVSITNQGTGEYLMEFTIPLTYSLGDQLQVDVEGEIGGTEDRGTVWEGQVGASDNASTVSITSTLDDATGILTIVCGDDYTDETESAVTFTVVDGTLPDLTDAVLTLTIRHKRVSNLTIVGTGSLLGQSSDGATIKFEIPHSETEKGRTAHGRSSWFYDIQAAENASDGWIKTLNNAEGIAHIILDQTQ